MWLYYDLYVKRLKGKNLAAACRFPLGRINLNCSEMKQEVFQCYHWAEVSNQPQGSMGWAEPFLTDPTGPKNSLLVNLPLLQEV